MGDEFANIRSWTTGRQSEQWLRESGVRIGIGDDTAVVGLPFDAGGQALEWLLAVDTMAEGVHFLPETMAEADIGYKALAANISDIAAMGGEPRHALVSVAVPPAWSGDPRRMERLYDGLYECADAYGVAIIGGDTTSSLAHLCVSVTVTGTVEAGRAIARSGAQPGDAVFLTGLPGMSAAGLHYLLKRGAGGGYDRECHVAKLVQAHHRPAPSVKAARLLAARGTCTSLNDVSDGVASEAWEIAEASGVAIALERDKLPVSGSLAAYAGQSGNDPLDWILYGGEDYVLLGTIRQHDAAAAKLAFNSQGLPFYLIGQVEPGEPGVALHTGGKQTIALRKRGYNHFR